MTRSFDQIRYGAGLAAAAAFSFLKINLIGGLSTGLAVATMVLVVIGQSFSDGPGPGHVGGAGIVAVLFNVRPVAFVLTVAILFISPFVLFALGNKYMVMKTAGRLIKDNGEDYLYPLIDAVLTKVKTSQPELLRKGGDTIKVKLRVIQEIKDSNDNKWAKRIAAWGLKKADLDGVDLGAGDLSFTQTIRDRIVSALQTFSTPSRSFFWMILAVQWAAVLMTVLKVV